MFVDGKLTLAAVCLFSLPLRAEPISAALSPLVDASQFRITAFASGLSYPYGMTRLSDGSLLVGSAGAPGTFYGNPGQILRLFDANSDGVAESQVVAVSGLPAAVTAVRQAGDLIVAATSDRLSDTQKILFFRQGATPADPFIQVGAINVEFAAADWWNANLTLAVRPNPADPGKYDIAFNGGSQFDNAAAVAPLLLTGLIDATVDADSIYMFTVDPALATPAIANLTKIAAGTRNAAGIDFDPATGDLVFIDNGASGRADELNRILAASIGGAVEDFGFPSSYIDYATGLPVGGPILPELAFLPIVTGQSKGAAEIAFAPAGFPAGFNDGLFIGFHGDFIDAGVDNAANPLVYADLINGTFFQFILPSQAGIGHLDSLLSAGDSLFVAEFSADGSIFNGGSGAIYQIQFRGPEEEVPEPGTGMFLLFGAGLLCLARFRRK